MKLAFSTLGCPDWTWQDILASAKDLGYNGVEIRGIGRDLNIPESKMFQSDNIPNVKARLQQLNLEISCLSSGVRLNEQFKIEQHIEDGKQYIYLAKDLGVKYVRVLADVAPEPCGDLPIDKIADSLKVLTELAAKQGVAILVETNGFFAKTENMLELINKVNSPALKVLWDIHHPYRFFNEPVAQTYAALKPYLAYLHIKDSMMENGKVEYKMMGYGDVPIKEVVTLLKADNFDGYVSLEWLKRWCHHLKEPGLIFPQYASYMQRLLK